VSCDACEKAESNPRTGHYEADCIECWCRAMAQSPAAHKALGGNPAELQDAIRARFPDKAKYHDARLKVWAWIRRLDPKD